jgi:hypothetical protein
VRNFPYEEAEGAWRQMLAATDLPEKERLLASLNARHDGAFTAAERRDIRRVATHTRITLGEHLAGDTRHAATPEQQLEFAESGAAYTLTVRASTAAAILAELFESTGGRATIEPYAPAGSDADRPMEPRANAPGSITPSQWDRWLAWRQAIATASAGAQVRVGDDATMIVVPLAVRP